LPAKESKRLLYMPANFSCQEENLENYLERLSESTTKLKDGEDIQFFLSLAGG
jgi:hypothetical protein